VSEYLRVLPSFERQLCQRRDHRGPHLKQARGGRVKVGTERRPEPFELHLYQAETPHGDGIRPYPAKIHCRNPFHR